MAGSRLLCVGALTHDSIYRLAALPTTPGKFIPEEAVQTAAGMASSAATAAARQGGAVTLWASAGDDALGAELIAELAAEGIDCSFVRRVPGGRSAIAAILVDREGERIIVPYYDPKTQAEPDALPFAMDHFDAVLTDVRWPGAAALALAAAKSAGIPAILDADVASRTVLERLMPLATHIVASRPAAAIWLGKEVGAEAAASAIADEFDALVAVTDGGAGTVWFDRTAGRVRHVPSPKVEAVDTLAAGDVFHGCFALSIAEDRDVEAAIAHASAAAALKCLRFGGRLGAPTRAETETFMEARRLAIVPILIPHSVDLVLRTVEALAAGGARGVEIVLRTSDALPALTAAKKRFPDLSFGAGTILTKADYDRSVDAGADFTISPGFAADLVEHALRGPIPFIPGVQTPSEVMTARAAGVTLLKFYPAEPAGGVDVLGDFASVFPDVAFMPSGKINAARLPAYLALKNVASVGGTWMHTERGIVLDAAEIARRMAETMALAAGRG